MLSQLKNLVTKSSALLIAQTLDLNLKAPERSTVQKDESVVLQITFSKEQMELLASVKELLSHSEVNPSQADVVVAALRFFLEKKRSTFRQGTVGMEQELCGRSRNEAGFGKIRKDGASGASRTHERIGCARVYFGSEVERERWRFKVETHFVIYETHDFSARSPLPLAR